MTIYAVRGILIFLVLCDLALKYIMGLKFFKTVGGIYSHAWLMLLNIELCIMQIIDSNYPYQRRLFITFGSLSLIGFCLLVRSFLLKEKGEFFHSKQFYILTGIGSFFMVAWSFLFRIHG